MSLSNIPKFERKNPHIRINVLKYNDVESDEEEEAEEILKNPNLDLVYRSINKNTNATPVNLLLFEGSKTWHYAAVTNLNRLLNSRYSNTRIQSRWCRNCIAGFRDEKALAKHQPLCDSNTVGASAFTMPEDLNLEFANWHKIISPAYTIYADFESVLHDNDDDDASRPQKHMPAAAAYLMIPTAKGMQATSHSMDPTVLFAFWIVYNLLSDRCMNGISYMVI